MEKLIFIKLGGSVITDKSRPFTAREKEIKRLGKEILEARRVFVGNIIVGHGSGSFGHSVAAKYKTQEGFKGKGSVKGLSLVSDAAVQINRIVISNLLKVGLPVVSFSPVSFIYSKEKREEGILMEPISQALKLGIVPVVYGDIIFHEKKGFCIYSAEKILNLLVEKFKDRYKSVKIIFCGDTDGVYDEKGVTISKITPENFRDYKKDILGSKKTDVTGGMLHKVEESLKIAKGLGIETMIVNGTKKGNLYNAVLNKEVKGKTLVSGY
jgi:isopentenyl phosphate kinase